jgi:hypothetical protein
MAVVALKITTPEGIGRCTGTLISPVLVLTAAHCVDTSTAEDVEVGFGHNANSAISYVEVKEVWIHPEWESNAYVLRNDIAMLRLKRPAPAEIEPIPFLPDTLRLTQDDVGKMHELVGFGQTDPINDYSTGIKMTITLPISHICGSSACVETVDGQTIMINRNNICHKKTNGGTCFGDSGGPAFFFRNNREYVVGVHSYHLGEEDCGFIACATKVDAFSSYILEIGGDQIGQACVTNDDCFSGSCVNQVCCDQTCSGRCYSCNQPGYEGQCRMVENGTSCSNNNICDGEETCQNGICKAEEGVQHCQDNIACTQDLCEPQTGCFFKPNSMLCEDNNICTKDICDPENGCKHDPLPDDLECGKCLLCRAGQCVDDPACAPSGCNTISAINSGQEWINSFFLLLGIWLVLVSREYLNKKTKPQPDERL